MKYLVLILISISCLYGLKRFAVDKILKNEQKPHVELHAKALPTFDTIAAGYAHSCYIEGGGLYCWGKNTRGQIGNGSDSDHAILAPVQIGSLTSWTSIAVGWQHTCGIQSGKLYCWGANSNGEVGAGSGSGLTINTPVQIGSLTSWTNIALGRYHTCGLQSGKLYCWGENTNGQIGNGSGSNADIETPVQIGSLTSWTDIALAVDKTCGIQRGKLYCWGVISTARDRTISSAKVPTQIGSLTSWTDIALGIFHACGSQSGKLYCWGRDSGGQVGNGPSSSVDIETPVQIGSLTSWSDIALGGHHSCGIESNKLYCWGSDYHGQIGNGSGSNANIETPVQIGSLTSWTDIAVGTEHTCGVESKKLYCWGSNHHGKVGISSNSHAGVKAPEQISVPEGSIKTPLQIADTVGDVSERHSEIISFIEENYKRRRGPRSGLLAKKSLGIEFAAKSFYFFKKTDESLLKSIVLTNEKKYIKHGALTGLREILPRKQFVNFTNENVKYSKLQDRTMSWIRVPNHWLGTSLNEKKSGGSISISGNEYVYLIIVGGSIDVDVKNININNIKFNGKSVTPEKIEYKDKRSYIRYRLEGYGVERKFSPVKPDGKNDLIISYKSKDLFNAYDKELNNPLYITIRVPLLKDESGKIVENPEPFESLFDLAHDVIQFVK